MKAFLVLLAHSFKRTRTLVITMAALLGVFQIVLILMATSMHRSGTFDQFAALIPPFIRELIGPSFTGFMSFTGIACLGHFHPVVIISLVALAIALGTAPATEIETGFIDLILSRPLRRSLLMTRSMVLAALCIGAILLTMNLAIFCGLNTIAPKSAAWPGSRLIGAMEINLALLLLCWNSIALAVASVSRRRGTAAGVVGVMALAAFLLDYIARAWKAAEPVAWLSPFRYYPAFELLTGQPLRTQNLLVLGLTATIAYLLAHILYAKRDISR